MKKTFWLSYDLGIKGDYEHLYIWLDKHEAVECGDSVACFKYDVPVNLSDDEIIEQLKDDLMKSVNLDDNKWARIYCIRKDSQTNGVKGKFIIGNRKGNPWEGMACKDTDKVEEGE